MVENYNSNFGLHTNDESDDSVVEYTVDNTVADAMLRPTYPIKYLTTLCLTAPSGGANYKWEIEVGENANGMEEGNIYTIGTNRTLTVYIKESPYILRWGSYKLTLTVQKIPLYRLRNL